MRVVVLSDLVRPNGAGVMALLAADMLTNAGHEAVVLGGAIEIGLQQHLARLHFGAAAFTNDEASLDGSVTSTDHVALLASVGRWLDAQLVDMEPDLIFIHNCGRIMSQLDIADLSTKYPVVHTMHDEWFFTDSHYRFRSGPNSPVVRTSEPRSSDSVIEHRYEHLWEIPERVGNFTAIAPSQWMAQRASQVFPTLDVVHLPNAVDTSLFDLQDRAEARALLGLPQDRSIVLFVGSATQIRKGFRKFEHAMRHAIGAGGAPPMRLVAGGTGSVVSGTPSELFGPGPLAEVIARPALAPIGALGIEGDGLVLSGLERALMPALYGAANVLVHPSAIDNLPTVPIEAGLCGTDVLASDVGGTRETVADESGLFDQWTSPAELGDRISTAIAKSEAETAADRQRRRDTQLARFAISTHQDELMPLLARLAEGGNR